MKSKREQRDRERKNKKKEKKKNEMSGKEIDKVRRILREKNGEVQQLRKKE